MLRRQTTFTTDSEGRPAGDVVLSPATEYVVFRDEDVPGVPTFHDRSHLADWLNYAVLGDLRTLVHGIEVRQTMTPIIPNLGGGNFLLAAGCCMALEYFGQVYGAGGDSTGRARAYTDRFLTAFSRKSILDIQNIFGYSGRLLDTALSTAPGRKEPASVVRRKTGWPSAPATWQTASTLLQRRVCGDQTW